MSTTPLPTIINGQMLDADAPHWPAALPHGLRFADGCFETMLLKDERIALWDYHWRRLSYAANILDFGLPARHTIEDAIRSLRDQTGLSNAIIRLQCSLKGSSTGYLPDATPEEADWLLEIRPHTPHTQPISLHLSGWRSIPPTCFPTELKTMQGMHARLARCDAAAHGADQPLRLSTQNHLCETGTGNLFFFKANTLFTPHLSTGAIAGVMRALVMDHSPYAIEEGLFELEEIKDAEAIFSTNAVQGLTPISSLQPLGWTWSSSAFTERLSTTLSEHMPHGLA